MLRKLLTVRAAQPPTSCWPSFDFSATQSIPDRVCPWTASFTRSPTLLCPVSIQLPCCNIPSRAYPRLPLQSFSSTRLSLSSAARRAACSPARSLPPPPPPLHSQQHEVQGHTV